MDKTPDKPQVSPHDSVMKASRKKTAELWRVYERLAKVEQEAADLRKLLAETEAELEGVADTAENAIYHLHCLVNWVALRIPDVINPPQVFVAAAYYLSKQSSELEAEA